VQPWAIVGQPRKYAQRDGADIDVGWARDLAHTTERRLVRIEVAKVISDAAICPTSASARFVIEVAAQSLRTWTPTIPRRESS